MLFRSNVDGPVVEVAMAVVSRGRILRTEVGHSIAHVRSKLITWDYNHDADSTFSRARTLNYVMGIRGMPFTLYMS